MNVPRDWEPPQEPHAFIQWKGTDVCMDFHCPCDPDKPLHYDGGFAYVVECPHCHTRYEMNWYVTARVAVATDWHYDRAKMLDAS